MNFRKIFAAVTAAAMCLTVSSCGKQLPEPETASKEHVFREERVKLQGLPETIEAKFYSDGKVYIIGTFSQSEGDNYENIKWSSETRLKVVNLEGETELDVPIGSREGGAESFFGTRNIMKACPDADGGIVTIDENREKNSYGEYGSVYYLVRYSAEGEKLSEANLEKVMEELNTDSLFICGMTALEDGLYMLSLDKSIAVIDKDGKLIADITDSALPENTRFYGFVTTADGRIFTSYNTYEIEDGEYVGKIFLVELDVPNKKFGEKYQVASPNFISGNDEYDLFVVRESGLAGYDIETGETETIIDWLKSGFDKTAMPEDAVNVLPDRRILCFTYDYTYEGDSGFSYDYRDMVLALLTEIPPEEVPDKKLIKLYALKISDGIRRRIIEFNRNNPEYEIELTSYADYIDGADRMNIDMVSGNVPDVLLLGKDGAGYDILADSYISKGLLANLYDFMNGDPDFNRSDYLENYFKAYEVGGKLYEIAPTFNIATLPGKTSRVGEKQGWTMEEFSALTENMTGEEILGVYRKDYVLEMFLNNCSDSYINRNKGKCSFDSDEFISVLKFCNKFLDEDPEDYPYVYETAKSLREDNQLLLGRSADSPNDIRTLEKGDFGDSVTLKGFPCSKGNGSCFADHYGIKFAISSRSSVPEGAWKFVKSFLDDEYQEQFSGQQVGRVPIKLSAIEKKYANEQKPFEYADNNGVTYYINENLYDMGTTRIDIGYPDEADADRMMNFIKTVTTVQRKDRYVTAIVEEEAGAYFAGQKSAEEVAKIIQNRVQNYLNENR